MSLKNPSYQPKADRALCALCDRPMTLTVSGTFRHHQLAPSMLRACPNGGRNPIEQLRPVSPPRTGPPPRSRRAVVDL